VIDEADAALVKGFIVNKFRGDPALFAPAFPFIEARTGWRSLGLLPHFRDASRLPAEDAVALSKRHPRESGKPVIAVPKLSRIANFDDFDPLRLEPEVELVFVEPGRALPVADLVILPGSKATIADLAFFRAQGWDIDLAAHARRGGRVLGLCAGYQMLGKRVADPDGIEGPPGAVEGLGLLDVETIMTGEKTLRAVKGNCLANGAPFTGYEMHIGRTTGPDTARPMLEREDGARDGATSANGRVMGAYAHGLFADDLQRAARLKDLGAHSTLAYEEDVEATLDALAAHVERHLDVAALLALAA